LLDIISYTEAIEVDNPELKDIIKQMEEEADLSMLEEENRLKIAKLELVLRKFAKEKGLLGIGLQCWTAIQRVYGVSPCYIMGRLTNTGIMTSCEVDIYGALTMILQYQASLKATPPHFIDWTIQHQEKKDVFLSWHCGNAPPSLACKNCLISVKYHSIMGHTLGSKITKGTAEFQLKPGLVTICRLVEYNDEFKMLVTKGEIRSSQQTLRGSWSWVEVPNLDLLYRTLVKEGFTHHASIIHGDYTRAIVDACEILGIKPIVV
jgi:L-fucose isomerase-like protein